MSFKSDMRRFARELRVAEAIGIEHVSMHSALHGSEGE